MAERYRRERTLPTFQQADLSGFFAAAQETGAQAAAVGQQAGAVGQQARILEDVSAYFGRVGAKLAAQHGAQKPIGPMRDSDGNMVPLVQRVTLNISDQVYQERQVKAWHAEALNAYKDASESEAEKNRLNPQGYAEAMTEVREQILAAAPGSLTGMLETQLQDYSLGVHSGIQSLVNKQDRQRADAAIEQNIDRSQGSFLAAVVRDGESLWTEEGIPNPELYGEGSDILQAADTIPAFSSGEDPEGDFTPQHRAFADNVAHLGMQGWFDSKASMVRQMYSTDSTSAQNAMLEYQRMIENDEVRVPGWPGKFSDGMGGVFFSQLPQDMQDKLRAHMGRMNQRVGAEAQLRNNYSHEQFQEEYIPGLLEVRDAYPQEIRDPKLRQHIENFSGIQGVDPAFVRAMIWQESKNNPNAGSPTGVQGLMQVTEDTGAWMATSLREKYDPNRTNPYSSSKYGITYIGKLQKQAAGWCPQCNYVQRMTLVAAAYNVGPLPFLRLKKKVDLSNPSEWLPALEAIKMVDTSGNPVRGKEGANHARKVMASWAALTGGMGLFAQNISDRAMNRFPNPRDYVKAMNRFHSNWTQANSMAAYNAGLTYTPPAYDADMARAFVDEQWTQLYNPLTQNPNIMAQNTAQSIVRMVQGDTDYGHRVQMEAFAKANAAMRSGNTKQAQRAQQLMSLQGGARHTESDAALLDKQLPGEPISDTLNWFKSGVDAGQDMAGLAMQRHRLHGQKTNGRLNAETMTLTDLGMRALATGNMTQDQAGQFTGFLNLLYGGARQGKGHVFAPGIQQQAQAVWTSRENLRRLRPGPSGRGANMLAAVDFARDNAYALSKGDVEAQQSLYRILHGQTPKESWEMQSVETQDALNTAIQREIVEGLPSFRDQMVEGILPNHANVTSRAGTILLEEVLRGRHLIDKDNVGSALDYGIEGAFNRGRLGYSRLTFDYGVVGNEGSDTTKNMFVENPVDNDMSKYAAVLPDHYAQFKNVQIPTEDGTGFEPLTIEVPSGRRNQEGGMIMEEVPAERGTIFGAAQAAFDDLGKEASVVEEFKRGNLLFFTAGHVRSPGGLPAVVLQVMRKMDVSGADEGEWRQSIAFDTGEMEDIAATLEFREIHKRAAALSAPMLDVAGILSGLTGEFRYEEAQYGEGWLERELRPLGSAVTFAHFGLSPLGRGFFETEELPERLQINPGELPGRTREEFPP